MIIFYNDKTGEIYGTADGSLVDESFSIHPADVDIAAVSRLVVDKKWEKDNPEIAEAMQLHRVVDAKNLKFEEDIRKTKPYEKPDSLFPCRKMMEKYEKRITELEAQLKDKTI